MEQQFCAKFIQNKTLHVREHIGQPFLVGQSFVTWAVFLPKFGFWQTPYSFFPHSARNEFNKHRHIDPPNRELDRFFLCQESLWIYWRIILLRVIGWLFQNEINYSYIHVTLNHSDQKIHYHYFCCQTVLLRRCINIFEVVGWPHYRGRVPHPVT